MPKETQWDVFDIENQTMLSPVPCSTRTLSETPVVRNSHYRYSPELLKSSPPYNPPVFTSKTLAADASEEMAGAHHEPIATSGHGSGQAR